MQIEGKTSSRLLHAGLESRNNEVKRAFICVHFSAWHSSANTSCTQPSQAALNVVANKAMSLIWASLWIGWSLPMLWLALCMSPCICVELLQVPGERPLIQPHVFRVKEKWSLLNVTLWSPYCILAPKVCTLLYSTELSCFRFRCVKMWLNKKYYFTNSPSSLERRLRRYPTGYGPSPKMEEKLVSIRKTFGP